MTRRANWLSSVTGPPPPPGRTTELPAATLDTDAAPARSARTGSPVGTVRGAAGPFAGWSRRPPEGDPNSLRRAREADRGRDRLHGRPRARAQGRPHVALPGAVRGGDRGGRD